MKSIRCLKDIEDLANILPVEFLEYLTGELSIFYELFSDGEGIREFNLDIQQVIIIVEEVKELEMILQDKLNLEYVDKIELESISCLRIGVNMLEDIQIYYFI